jgi:hypothetical protein
MLMLSACASKTTQMNVLEIPSRYLNCDDYSSFNPTADAIDRAENGDYKKLAIELAENSLLNNIKHTECFNSMKNIKSYQEFF